MPEANLFHLDGHNVHVEYATTGIAGQPSLTYHDPNKSLSFSGDQIESVSTEAGTVVSVITRRTVDTGSTSFSVIIPRTNIEPAGSTLSIRTVGITAIHRFSIVPTFSRGQLDSYTTISLHGSAQTVES
jgi:hypothetical protein